MAIVWEPPAGGASLEETATEVVWRQLLVQALTAVDLENAVPAQEPAHFSEALQPPLAPVG